MTCRLIYKILPVFIIAGLFGPIYAQEDDNPDVSFDTYMELSSTKFSDGTRDVIVTLTADSDEGEIPLSETTVSFYTVSDTGNQLLGNVLTNDIGTAIFTIESGWDFPKDEEDYITFFAAYDGNENFGSSEAELQLKDVRLELDFSLVDEVKMIDYSGYIIGKEGEEYPLADDDIYLYVPRMFNLMKIVDGWLEEDGKGSNEFPLTLIGDTLGKVTVIAKIEEHYDYGDVETSAEIDWAIPKHSGESYKNRRELWTPIAPLWMIVTLIIMLVGVWGHYIYAIIQLLLIKRSSKQLK